MIRVVSFRDRLPEGALVVNTTSRSNTTSRQLSPFFLGPCRLWDHHVAMNVENGWQFSKLYPCHADAEGNPTEAWFEWSRRGWADPRAQRYPMGKGIVPLCSWWDGERLGYIEARRRIYIPLYAKAVAGTEAFAKLCKLYKSTLRDIFLLDFDAYDHRRLNMSWTDVVHSTSRKMGHAFVLAMMLEGVINPDNPVPPAPPPPTPDEEADQRGNFDIFMQ